MMNQHLKELLERNKRFSDDPHTKVSCVIFDENEKNAIWGANRLTVGLYPDDVSLERPEKYDWIEHAERHAIYECARYGIRTQGAKMYLTGFPCVDCGRAIVNSGIAELHCMPATFFDEKRYGFDKSRRILEAGGVMLFEDYESLQPL